MEQYQGFIILGAVILLVLIFIWAIYNRLIKLNEQVEEAFSDITVQLKQRAELIPNLISTVKGYAKHEVETLEKVINARSGLTKISSVKDIAKSDSATSSALEKLLVIAEQYPDLKASENFLSLQADLKDLENKIQAARRFYNAGAKEFNIKFKVFPSNIFAKMLGFKVREYYKVDESETERLKTAPKVEF